MTIQQVTFDCDPPEPASVEVRLLPTVPREPVMVVVQVVAGGTVVLRSPDDPDVVFDEAPVVGCA